MVEYQFFIDEKWLDDKAISLAKELNVEEAMQIALKINKQIEQALIEILVKLKSHRNSKKSN